MQKNSEIINYIIQAIIKTISRRTTKNFAVVTIHTVIKKLELKYDFLRFIEIDNKIYSEGINAVKINKEIDFIEMKELEIAINEIIDTLIEKLGKDKRYYFTKEIKEDIESKFRSLGKDIRFNLDLKQYDYISDEIEWKKTTEVLIKNSYIIESVIKALINILNKKYPEAEVIKTLKTSIKKLENINDITGYIIINDTPDEDGYYTIETKTSINDVISIRMADMLERFIEEIGRSIEWNTQHSFLEEFQSALGDENIYAIKKLGVNLNHIGTVLRQQENEIITKKILNTLIELGSMKISIGFTVETIDFIIKKVKLKHDVLKYVTIDKYRYNEGLDAIFIDPAIKTVESNKLGKALWEIIKNMQEFIRDRNFIENLKKELGEEYLQKIEEIGVNLHFLEIIS
jgi:hypothetical protein